MRQTAASVVRRCPCTKNTSIHLSNNRYFLYNNTGINPNPTFYFLMRKFTTRGVCGYPHGPWGVPTTAGPADKHDPPLRGATLLCQGPTTDGKTSFLILNFALKDPGKRALPLMHLWKEHSFLRRHSYGTQKFCDSSIPKTNEDLPP